MTEYINVNRNHKDTVFRMLFKDKARLLELFNAINDTDYQDTKDIEITTLENAVYMTGKNDIACVVDMRMTLFEHQSSVNPNMPLRDLMYVAKSFSKYRVYDDIFTSRRITLPNPKFIVFYNGIKDQPLVTRMKLSDMYAHDDMEVNLELIVTQININLGKSSEIMEACQTLKEYSQFIDTIRKYQENYDVNTSVNMAIDECIERGVLADFLRSNRAEVQYMSLFEFDEEKFRNMLREEGRKEGREEGREEGRKEGREEGRKEGREEGREEGRKEGRSLLIKSMLESGKTAEEIATFCGVELNYVKEIEIKNNVI